MLTLQQAQAAITQRNSNNSITPQQVQQLLANVHGVTLASILTVTKVATAAAHKAINVQKVTAASVQLFNNVNDYDIYAKAVKRSATRIDDNSAAAVAGFVAQDSYFAHTNTFSLVQHKKDSTKFYLYAIYNNAQSMLFIDNTLATKQQVAALCTASAAKALLEENTVQQNVTHNILHNVVLRTIALDSIVQLKAQKQTLTV